MSIDRELMQELFDKALFGVREQGRASSVLGSCRYRVGKSASDRCRCGIGHIVPDELYTVHMEGHNIHTLLEFAKIAKSSPMAPSDALWSVCNFLKGINERLPLGFLQELQSAHDIPAAQKVDSNEVFLGGFEHFMSNLALRYRLEHKRAEK